MIFYARDAFGVMRVPMPDLNVYMDNQIFTQSYGHRLSIV